MSRHSPDIDREETREDRQTRPEASIGSGGGTSIDLTSTIDEAAAGKPTFTQFFERLRARGVEVVPSVNARGLNGMSYVFAGATVRGSDLGRAYTAKSLQQRKGVDYLPERDAPAIRAAVERAAVHARERTEAREARVMEPGSRRRDRFIGLSRDQVNTLLEVGTFRTVGARDLIRHRYGGRYAEFQCDVRALSSSSLLERRSAVHPKSGRTYDIVVLTTRGRNFARMLAKRNGSGQQFYAGLVKPQEIGHDIGIYRMYQRELTEIERRGGKVLRTVMDFEIKRRLMSELNKRGADPRDQGRKAAIGARNSIKVVEGRFVIPDLRIEYETREGDVARVDLELATAAYKPAQIAAKCAAGMKVYSASSLDISGLDTGSGGTPWEQDLGLGASF